MLVDVTSMIASFGSSIRGIRNLLDPYVALAVPGHCLHVCSVRRRPQPWVPGSTRVGNGKTLGTALARLGVLLGLEFFGVDEERGCRRRA